MAVYNNEFDLFSKMSVIKAQLSKYGFNHMVAEYEKLYENRPV